MCYKKGGHLAITDANLMLGRIMPDMFPKIFGPQENEALDVAGTRAAFEALAAEVAAFEAGHGRPAKSVDEVAIGFIAVANETMCRPIRALTQMKVGWMGCLSAGTMLVWVGVDWRVAH